MNRTCVQTNYVWPDKRFFLDDMSAVNRQRPRLLNKGKNSSCINSRTCKTKELGSVLNIKLLSVNFSTSSLLFFRLTAYSQTFGLTSIAEKLPESRLLLLQLSLTNYAHVCFYISLIIFNI